MEKVKTLLTEQGYQELKNELDNLINVKRPENIKAIKDARALGDLSENAEYDAARNEQAEIEGRISQLEKLLENVEILAVKDSSGNPVFETSTEERTPSQIIFSVTDEMHKLLRKAEYIQDAELILVPTNVSYETNDGETIDTIITSDYIKNYIEQRSIDVN